MIRPRSDMRPYQVQAAQKIIAIPKLLLAMDMGLGKTTTVSTAIADMYASGEITRRVLVVAPLNVAKNTWHAEIEGWEHLKHLTTSRILGTVKQREKALAVGAQIEIINKENLPWLIEWMKENGGIHSRYDMVVWDESSSLKEGKIRSRSGNASRFGSLVKLVQGIKRVALLSGTPVPEGIEGLWGQMYIIDDGYRLGRYKSHFYQRWFRNISRTPQFPTWQAMPGSADEILKVCDDVIVKLKSADLIDLPARIDISSYIELPEDAMKFYKKFKKDLTIEIDEVNVLAPSAAVLVGKLAQVASGTLYDADKVSHEIHRSKIEALETMVEESTENMLVFYYFKEDLARLKKAFPQAEELSTPGVIQRWNAGKVKLMLAHPGSAAHGLNLQHGGSVCVWFTLPWSLEQYQQANKRLHRSGQRSTVRIYHLLAKGTVDELIYAALLDKAQDSDMFYRDPKTVSAMVAEVMREELPKPRESIFKRKRL